MRKLVRGGLRLAIEIHDLVVVASDDFLLDGVVRIVALGLHSSRRLLLLQIDE